MLAFVAVVAALRSTVRSRLELTAEILALRHQLVVLRSQAPKRLRLRRTDRWLWVLLSRVWTGWRGVVQIVTPDTVVAWHRKGFALYWHWRSRPRGTGRPPIAKDVRDLIRQMQKANPPWGAPRIHAGLLKLGIEIAQATVAKCLRRQPAKPPSQSWRTFLSNHASQLGSIDFFTVPTATFRLLIVFVVLSHDRRRIVHFNVTAHPTATWTAQQLREAQKPVRFSRAALALCGGTDRRCRSPNRVTLPRHRGAVVAVVGGGAKYAGLRVAADRHPESFATKPHISRICRSSRDLRDGRQSAASGYDVRRCHWSRRKGKKKATSRSRQTGALAEHRRSGALDPAPTSDPLTEKGGS